MEIFLFSFILIFIITGIHFSLASLKSKNLEVKLKGKFLLLAFISFTIGASIEVLVHLNSFTVIITRSILISNAIEFYLGFIMPEWMKKSLLKRGKSN